MHSLVLRRARHAVPLTLFVLAACGDDPSGPRFTDELAVSASVMRERAAQIQEVSQQAPLRALMSGFFGFPMTSAAVGVPRLSRVAGMPPMRGALDAAPRRQATMPLLPVNVLGRTFVRAVTGQWVVDTLANGQPRPGAPALGVRFMLQETDMFGGLNGPLVGMIDVTPSVGSQTALAYHAVTRTMAGTVGLDYESTSSTTSLVANGEAIGGTRRITMSERATASSVVSTATASFAGVTRTSTYEGDASDIAGPVKSTMTLRVDDATLKVVSESSENTGSYRIYSNGALFARMDLEEDPYLPGGGEPVWYHGDGTTALDAGEEDALFAVFELASSLPDLLLIDITVQFWMFELTPM